MEWNTSKKIVWYPFFEYKECVLDLRCLQQVGPVFQDGEKWKFRYWTGPSCANHRWVFEFDSEDIAEAYRRDLVKAWKERT